MPKTLPLELSVAEAKDRLLEIVSRAGLGERIVLTRHGRQVAVVLSLDELESIEETLDILSDPNALREIRDAEAEIDRGEYITADELRAKYLQR